MLKATAGATGAIATGPVVGTVAARRTNGVGFIAEEEFNPDASSFEILGPVPGDTLERSPGCHGGGRERVHQGYAIEYSDGQTATLYVDERKRVEPRAGYNHTRGFRDCGEHLQVHFLDVGPEGLNP